MLLEKAWCPVRKDWPERKKLKFHPGFKPGRLGEEAIELPLVPPPQPEIVMFANTYKASLSLSDSMGIYKYYTQFNAHPAYSGPGELIYTWPIARIQRSCTRLTGDLTVGQQAYWWISQLANCFAIRGMAEAHQSGTRHITSSNPIRCGAGLSSQ